MAVSYRVWRSRWLYERRVDDDVWVAFVPHRPGLPCVIDGLTHRLLEMGEGGADTEDVVRRLRDQHPGAASAPALRTLIAACTALGFLGYEREPPRFSAAPSAKRPRRLSAWLHLTGNCNLSCSYCFVEKTGRNMSAATLRRAVDAIVSTAVARGALDVDARLAGGEPTLVVPMLEQAHALLERRLSSAGIGLTVRVITNGTRAGARFLAFAKRPGVGIAVSIDGFGPAHDLHRTFKGTARGSWNRVSANVDRLLASGAAVVVAATLSERSCASLPDLVRWTIPRSLAVHVQCVSEPDRPWRGSSPAPDEFRAFNERLFTSLDAALSVLETRLEKGETVPGLTIDTLNFDEPSFDRCCGIGTGYVTITEDGEAAPCPALAATRRTGLGDDLVAATAALLPGSSARRNEREEDACLACQWFPVCSGGCPAINQRVNGDEVSASPFCAFRRSAIPRYVDFLGRELLPQARLDGIRDFRILQGHT